MNTSEVENNGFMVRAQAIKILGRKPFLKYVAFGTFNWCYGYYV